MKKSNFYMPVFTFCTPLEFTAKLIWNLAEFSGIGLGKFAPRIFGWCAGSKGVKVK